MIELTLDSNDSQYQIRAYRPGELQINETIFHQSLIITPAQLFHPWPPQTFSEMGAHHVAMLLSLPLDVILIGTGSHFHHCPIELCLPFYRKKIGVECMTTRAACRTFNVLAAEKRNVAAALIIA